MNIEKPKFGVVGISYNEEEDLPGFLEHLINWVDEIVIVDSGSNDNTTKIIRESKFDVKLIETTLQKENGFAGLRNLGIRHCKCDWIINMDIDERISYQFQQEILTAIKSTNKNAFKYRRLNYFLHRPMKAGGWNTWNYPQLARKGFHHYEGILHESCIIKGGDSKIGQLKNYMLHLNDESYMERLEKSLQYCSLESKKLIAENKKIKSYHFIILPIFEFLKKYFLKKGFIDGIPGLISAIHSSNAIFKILALTWDSQNKIDRNSIV